MATLDSLDKRVTDAENNITNIKSSLNSTNVKVSNAEADIDNIESNVAVNRDNIKDNTERIKKLEEFKSSADTDFQLLKSSQSNINEDIVDLSEHIDNVEQQADDIEKKHAYDITDVKNEIVNIYEGLTTIQDKVNGSGTVTCPATSKPIGCPYCSGTPDEEEVVPETATIMDKLVSKYLKEQISDLFCTIIPRHDSSSNWTLNNPILSAGEYGVEDDTHRVKRGDGETVWVELPYETFGIDKIVISNAEDITYDNSETGLVKDNVQDALDYLIENLVSLRSQLDLKETTKNKVYTIAETDVNDVTYPTTKAVYTYVHGLVGDGDISVVVPDSPTTGTYVLQSVDGVLQWVEPSAVEGLDDLRQEVNDLKDRLDAIENLNEVEF